jgi:hypothetical protein
VNLLERWEVSEEDQGTSQVFFARTREGKFLFKKEGKTQRGSRAAGEVLGSYANFEGELLATRLLQTLSILTPRTMVASVTGLKGRFLLSAYIDQETFGEGKIFQGVASLPPQGKVDLQALRRLQVADLLMGNADRHGGNLWFRENPTTGLLEPIAFDHSFAFGNSEISPQWEHGAAFSLPISHPSQLLGTSPSWQTREILSKNACYRGALVYPEGVEDYLREAERIRTLLTDEKIGELVAELPRQVFGGRSPVIRRTEMFRGLMRRRDALKTVLVGALRSTLPALVGAVLLDALPPHLAALLPQEVPARTHLELSLGNQPRRSLSTQDRSLRQAGLGMHTRRKILVFLQRQAGLQGTLHVRHLKPSSPSSQVTSSSWARVEWLTNHQALLPEHSPARWMLQASWGTTRGVWGSRRPEIDNPAWKVLQRAQKDLAPDAEELLRVLYIPRTPGIYQVLVQGPDGTIHREAAYQVRPIEDLSRPTGVEVFSLDGGDFLKKRARLPWGMWLRVAREKTPNPRGRGSSPR